jgi:hypothetical protein
MSTAFRTSGAGFIQADRKLKRARISEISFFDLGTEQSALSAPRVDGSYSALHFLHASVRVAYGQYDFDICRTCFAFDACSFHLGLLRFHLYEGFGHQPRARNHSFFQGVINHCGYNIPAPHVISSTFHDAHHRLFNCNYGSYGLFDYLHGTIR